MKQVTQYRSVKDPKGKRTLIMGTWTIPRLCPVKAKRRVRVVKKGGKLYTIAQFGAIGNFTLHIGRDKYGELVMNVNLFALKKKQSSYDWGGDIIDFTRQYFLLKRPTTIKGSLLARIQDTEMFCREKIRPKKIVRKTPAAPAKPATPVKPATPATPVKPTPGK